MIVVKIHVFDLFSFLLEKKYVNVSREGGDLSTTFSKLSNSTVIWVILEIFEMYASNDEEDWIYLHETPPMKTIAPSISDRLPSIE